jgi:hypothetical protein
MMVRNRYLLIMVCMLLIAGFACDAPIGRSSPQPPDEPAQGGPQADTTGTPTHTPPPSPLPPTATETPLPTHTPTVTLTPTPADPFVSPLGEDVLCYFGPGDDYLVDGGLLSDERVPVLGRDEWSQWWQIENPRREGKFCWVSADETIIEGNPMLAEIVAPPLNFVTYVEVSMHPSTISLSPCVFPTTFDVDFTVEVTGPCTVKLQRSLSNGNTAPVETVNFTKGGTKSFSDYYRVGSVGEHWFQVSVSSPNSISAKGYGEVVCP